MGTEFWWIFDALVVMIAVYLIYSNAKRGLTKVFVLNIGYVTALFLSGLVAVTAGPQLYEATAKTTDLKAFQEIIEKMNVPKVLADAVEGMGYGFRCEESRIERYLESNPDRYAINLYHYVKDQSGAEINDFTAFTDDLRDAYVKAYSKAMDEKLPAYVRMNFVSQIEEDPGVMTELLAQKYAPNMTSKVLAEDMEERFGQEPNTEILRMFIYVGCFAVIMIIAAVISSLLKNSLFFNVTGSSERVYGALLGLAETICLLILFTIVVRLIVMLGGGETLCFNDPTIERTKIFRLLYDHLNILI